MKINPEWRNQYRAYITHTIPLELTVRATMSGDILELGMGDNSTKMLNAIAKDLGRKLCSLDDDPSWIAKFIDLSSDYHAIERIHDWNDHHWFNKKWGAVFVDHNPAAQRKISVEKLADLAEFIIVHDTENPAFEFESVFAKFKYRYDYTFELPNTTILSNFSVCDIKGIE